MEKCKYCHTPRWSDLEDPETECQNEECSYYGFACIEHGENSMPCPCKDTTSCVFCQWHKDAEVFVSECHNEGCEWFEEECVEEDNEEPRICKYKVSVQ